MGYSVNKKPRRMSEVRLSSDGLFSPFMESNSPASSVASMQLKFNRHPTQVSPPHDVLLDQHQGGDPTSSVKPLNITRGSLNQPEKLSMEKLDELVKEASAGEKSPLFDKDENGNGGIFKLNFGERCIFVQESKASSTVGRLPPSIDSFP